MIQLCDGVLFHMTNIFNFDFECPATVSVLLGFKYLTSSPLRDFSHVLSKKSSIEVFYFTLLLCLPRLLL